MAGLFSRSNILFMLDGLRLTILISLATIALSIVVGTVLAIMRNYGKGKWRFLGMATTAYIELFRCTPNVLWILLLRFSMKGSPLFISIFTFTLFTSAVVAEIIRGGLNAIPKSQFESAASQGFHFPQTLLYIALPQTFRSIIPALISQMTTIIKDTSFLKVVDIHEFMRNSSVVLGSATTLAQICLLYGFVAITYFALNFLLSWMIRVYHKSLKLA